jgi:hypothetical protein
VAQAYAIPTMWEAEAGASKSKAGPGQNARPCLKNKTKKDWKHGSSGSRTDQQSQGSEFKLQYQGKKRET